MGGGGESELKIKLMINFIFDNISIGLKDVG